MRFSTKTLVAFSLSLATVTATLPISIAKAQAPEPATAEVTSDEAATLAQVDAYVEAWQLEDAIALLEGVASEGSQLPSVYHKLGDLYLQAGYDSEKAVRSYTIAMQLAEESGNLEAEAEAQVSIAGILLTEGYPSEAKKLLANAKNKYEATGNLEQATEINNQLVTLVTEASEVGTSSRLTLRGRSQEAEESILDIVNLGFCPPCESY
jgi:tetratricopeptide (TPR) repeat protein